MKNNNKILSWAISSEGLNLNLTIFIFYVGVLFCMLFLGTVLSIAILGLLLIAGAWFVHKTRKYIRDVYLAQYRYERSRGLIVTKEGKLTTNTREFFKSQDVMDKLNKLSTTRIEKY